MAQAAHPPRPDSSGELSVDRAQVAGLARELKALAHPMRLAILEILGRAGRSVCVCELEAALPVKQPTVSHHLRLLRQAGLIECEQRGVWAYYSVRPGRLSELWTRLTALAGRSGGGPDGRSD